MRRSARWISSRPTAVTDISQFTSPVVATSAMRLASQLRLADRVKMPANVVITNVPGPRQPLYFAGARMDHYIPVSTIAEGMGLNITVHSYLDELDFGLIAGRELVPDLWDMVDMHIDEIGRLFEATGATWAVPPRPAPPRRGPAKRRAVTAATAAKAAKGDQAHEEGAQVGQEGAQGSQGGQAHEEASNRKGCRLASPRHERLRARRRIVRPDRHLVLLWTRLGGPCEGDWTAGRRPRAP